MQIVALIDADSAVHKAEWNRTIEEAYVYLEDALNDVISGSFCDKYLIAIRGKDNFRRALYPDYKGHRAPSDEKMNNLDLLYGFLISKWKAIEADDQEADDLLVQWRERVLLKGNLPVICSGDKDLLTVPGTHYLMNKHRLHYQSPEAAEYFFNKQLLMGDPTDKIPGLPGVGPVRATEMLEGALTPFDQRQVVIAQYKRFKGAEWKDYLQLQGELLYIRRVKGEGFLV